MRQRLPALTLVALLLAARAAHVHTGEGFQGGLASGFTHPLFGGDHVVAMVAVGLWGAFLGRPAIWLLPVVFPLIMAFGGALGVGGVPLPTVEAGIALSSFGQTLTGESGCRTCLSQSAPFEEPSSANGRSFRVI